MTKTIVDIEDKFKNLVYFETDLDRCLEFLTYLEGVIPEFFSRNGESNGIHKMFNYITESTMNTTIEAVDVKESANIYSEYIDGMLAFINDVKNSPFVESANMESIEKKLETASVNDEIFVDSIFGGSVNGTKETSITEAVENIEYLIEFLPKIKEFKNMLVTTTESVSLTPKSSDKHTELLNNSLDMLYHSVANYCKTNVTNIFESYQSIMNRIDNPDSDQPITESAYQLVW